jgi:hypothetical protein
MMLNHKQKELIEGFFYKVKEKYPEVEFLNLSTSPEDREHIWINVLADVDEDRSMEMDDYIASIETDIDSDYGYRISMMASMPNDNISNKPIVTVNHLNRYEIKDDLDPVYEFDFSKSMPEDYEDILTRQRTMYVTLEPEIARYFKDERQVIQFLRDQIKSINNLGYEKSIKEHQHKS